MYARTYNNITFAQVLAGTLRVLAALCVLFILCSCSSDTTLKKTDESTDSTDPLTFTCQLTQDAQTRAATTLTSDFIVSTYKAYATSEQQTVMDRYYVEYKTTGSAWEGTNRPYWDYTSVPGQYEKFWDYSHFPYRFHAIAPNTSSSRAASSPRSSSFLDHVTLSATTLTISAPYHFQTCLNGMVTPSAPEAEPYVVAQLHRDADGKDHDLLAFGEDSPTLNNSTTTRHREVWLPFHHLNAKIRFAVYSLAPWASANSLYISDLTIKVTSTSFTTAATGYEATCEGLGTEASPFTSWRVHPPYTGTAGFLGLTKTDALSHLLHFEGGKDIPGNDLRDCQTQKTAFFLQCQDGIMQLPQENVSMTVSMKIYNKADGNLYQSFTDVPIEYELDGTRHTRHTWQSGYLYTYYLVLGKEGTSPDKLSIDFTCTLTPWEDITGSLSTDLEQ